MTCQWPALEAQFKPRYQQSEVLALIDWLHQQGTFTFKTLPNGLFPAAVAVDPDTAYTGYHHVWVRDNVHVAHGHLAWGDAATAARTARSLLDWFQVQRPRFEAIITGTADPQEITQRPHIRFRGETLTESPERWAHAQNDALGYGLWLIGRLLNEGHLNCTAADCETLALFVRYFAAIRYWQDEDSGHWEETRKIEASSIGAVVAGLRELQQTSERLPAVNAVLDHALLTELRQRGEQTLLEILPNECIQPAPLGRTADGALLFLIYPLQVVTPELADLILNTVLGDLQGEHGIRRYLGDSYWCADYKTALPPEERSADFSDDLGRRDQLLKPGLEAQWCIFDPIVSVIYGQRYLASQNPADRDRQMQHLHRALGQVTGPDSRFGAGKCPESYFCEAGRWVPNDVTPLLWTQANLRVALQFALLTANDPGE